MNIFMKNTRINVPWEEPREVYIKKQCNKFAQNITKK